MARKLAGSIMASYCFCTIYYISTNYFLGSENLLKIIGNTQLAENTAKWLGEDYYPVLERAFADGELCPRFETSGNPTMGKTAALILQQHRGENINAYLMNYYLILGALKDAGFSTIIAVMPYFAYSRQHKQYLPNQPVSALTVAKLLEFCGADGFVTVTAHEPSVLPQLFSIPAINLSAMSVLSEFVSKKPEFSDAVIVAPDDGAEEMAKTLAGLLGNRKYTAFEKKRDVRTGEITMTPKNVELLKGHSVIIIDDMVSGGGTMVETARACSHHGATRIAAAFTHSILCGNALEKLRACCDEVIGTNTIESEVSKVDVSPLLAQALRQMDKK
ncbi:MAG: ribose-phosphate diphosphokinase [Candidatus Micrarchaeia archaeon]|jgi:ribose-phosphate pyrophosphokinase